MESERLCDMPTCDCCEHYSRTTDGWTPSFSGWLCPACANPRNSEQDMRPTNKDNLPERRRACSNCGRLGHLTRTCIAPAKAHDKIGVEVEGWWRDLSAAKSTAENWHMSGAEDGSLRYDESGETAAYEFRTRPGSLGETISQIVAVYPDKCDKSAGMHIHMSFKDHMDIASLASPQFLRFFKERWEAWGTRMQIHESSDFWARLRGDNDYCYTWSAPPRGNICCGDRYMQLNFTSFPRHKTLECRMLPLFRDARLAVLAVEEWVCIVEDFIQHVASTVWGTFDRDIAVPELRPEQELAFNIDDIESEEPALGNVETELSLDCLQSENTVSFDLEMTRAGIPAARIEEAHVDLCSVEPPAPDHVRLIGPAAYSNFVTRVMREQGW